MPVDKTPINRWTGTRYFIDGAHHNPGAVPLIISGDPSLAILAAGYRRYLAMQERSFPGDDSPERTSFRKAVPRARRQPATRRRIGGAAIANDHLSDP